MRVRDLDRDDASTASPRWQRMRARHHETTTLNMDDGTRTPRRSTSARLREICPATMNTWLLRASVHSCVSSETHTAVLLSAVCGTTLVNRERVLVVGHALRAIGARADVPTLIAGPE